MSDYYIIICSSTNHMLKASSLLIDANIERELIPVPAEYGSVCNTAIKISAQSLYATEEILKDKDVSVIGWFPYQQNSGSFSAERVKQLQDDRLSRIMGKMEKGLVPTKEEIIYLLGNEDETFNVMLLDAADQVRKQTVGDVVDVRGAIEFSNYCNKNCLYCGIRKDNGGLIRYRMSPEEIITKCEEIADSGMRTVILQSGEDLWYNQDRLIQLVTHIKRITKLRITLSVGYKEKEQLTKLYAAGVNNYLLKIENSNPRLYHRYHPDSNFQEREACSIAIKESGILLGTGNIVGLPGQQLADLADDLLYFLQLKPHMLGIGPFVPAELTPLEGNQHGEVNLTLRFIALARILLRNVFIPATTALATIDPIAQERALIAGANTLMLIMTPPEYRNNYQIYNNKLPVDMRMAKEIIQNIGRKLPAGLT